MRYFHKLLTVALAAFFIAGSALAQNAGTVTNHAFALGKGAGTTGYTSLLCGSAQLAVGQSAADPICRTITGDVTITAAGATAIGVAKITSAMLRDSVGLSVIGRSASTTGVPADIVGTADQILRVAAAGASVGFGSVDISKSAAVGASILALANGGCNAALTASNGGILYSTASACAIFAGTATANLPLLSGSSTTPSWAGVRYIAGAATSGGIPYFSSTTQMATSALLAANAIVLGGGAATAPVTMASLGTTTTLLHGNAAGAPTFGAVVSADMNITATSCSNQFVSAISTGGVGTCSTVTLAGAQFANQGTTATVLHGNGAGNPSFGAVALATDVSGTLPIANGGTNDTGTAWTTFAPALSCGTATFTLNSARWKTLGKTVFLSIDFNILTLGTCTTIILATLPITPQSGTGWGSRESAIAGFGVGATISAGSTSMPMTKMDLTSFAASQRIQLGGVFESQ